MKRFVRFRPSDRIGVQGWMFVKVAMKRQILSTWSFSYLNHSIIRKEVALCGFTVTCKTQVYITVWDINSPKPIAVSKLTPNVIFLFISRITEEYVVFYSVFNDALKYYKISIFRKTNVMHLLFSLLRVKGLYMFRALFAHPREALHKRHLVYCMRVVSWLQLGIKWNFNLGCTQLKTRKQYTTCRLCSIPWGWASNAWNI
jgi:WD40 repeat protein